MIDRPVGAGVGALPRRGFLRYGAAVGAALAATAAGLSAGHVCAAPRWRVIDAALRAGDLLFRRTVSLEGVAVSALDAAGRFSHVGLVAGHDAQGLARVVHACPPEYPGETGVREATAQDFVGAADVRDAAAARLPVDAAQARAVAQWALRHVGWDFNDRFALQSPHALYCTELVWAALRAQHLPQPALARWNTPLGVLDVVTLSALLALPGLRFLPQAVQREA